MLIPARFLNLRECVGKGHFGHVFRAQLNDPFNSHVVPVAVKTVRSREANGNIATFEQFMREAAIMRRLCHRNVGANLRDLFPFSIQILRIYGVCFFGDEAPLPSVVMPFMHFGDLRTFVSDSFRASHCYKSNVIRTMESR